MPSETQHVTLSSVLAASNAPASESAIVPSRILLAPWGEVESDNGTFVVDEESGRLAVQAFEEHRTDLPIDYEHQTLGGAFASPDGRAPAAGWIKRLDVEAGAGLFAEIEWTDEARAMLAGREYRYLSPVAIVRKSDRKLVAIHSAALTNKPAIVGMAPIINRIEVKDESDAEAEPMMALRLALDLMPGANANEVLLAASAKLNALRAEAQEHRVAERIQEAMRSGKLVEAQRGWAEALVAKEEGLFDEWLRTAPVIVRPGLLASPQGTDRAPLRNSSLAARAKAEYRSDPFLSRLTSEDAYVSDFLREVVTSR
ncbi:MAG: hypothetical protein HY287_05880 [Planctomycetes bacterium]|nr:hypothetical protein [Planctomycetota bacterium]MBI3833841.1 hypothetical protein [Planctomycetota bacterium]